MGRERFKDIEADMKATACAPANIAFIKYWGKSDPITRIPGNNSISMNLSEASTTTTVEFTHELKRDDIKFFGEDTVKENELTRISRALDRIRLLNKSKMFAKVVTQNSFPKATGIASSASGFASLTLAATNALGLNLSEKELSRLARTFSGTACRSIPDGFVEWQKGNGPDNSYAYSLYPPDYWDIYDVLVIVSKKMKKVSTTAGHELATTSPFYKARIKGMADKIRQLKNALRKKDFHLFGNIIEAESQNLHAICITSTPSLIYWEPLTVEIMRSVSGWREGGLESYFTIDAGPNVHVICEGKYADKLVKRLKKINGIHQIIVNKPGKGARITTKHLF